MLDKHYYPGKVLCGFVCVRRIIFKDLKDDSHGEVEKLNINVLSVIPFHTGVSHHS